MMRICTVVTVALAVVCMGASGCHKPVEREVALAFLESIRSGDTATVRYLSRPDRAEALIREVRTRPYDPRISVAIAGPEPQVRKTSHLVTVVFSARGADDGTLPTRVLVTLTRSAPPRVVSYVVEPDIR
jgi:hypothetical protein